MKQVKAIFIYHYLYLENDILTRWNQILSDCSDKFNLVSEVEMIS